ncbi:MAG: response regulator [Planctomycetales bacterium]|nr:response regulator [Planctomycetales bacterium]
MAELDCTHLPILVVDDDVVCCELLAESLREMGMEVDTTHDGTEAYEKICNGDFRIVISDWQMPGLTGLELCRRIRNRQLGEYVYFILLTSLDRGENLIRGLDAGADDFLTKPFDPDELQVRVNVAQRIVNLENRNLIVFSLAKLAESRDPETGAHLERMRQYSRVLTEYLSTTNKYDHVIDRDFIRAVYLTSPLHDIGKVGIPDEILLKPGKLSEDEFCVMKQHATIGAQTLDAMIAACPTAKYLELARDIAASHHEKFDGTGYPLGLQGEDIPLCGRIVALADVYDALTTKRVYKEAFSHEEARKIILDGAGKHFDPDVVEAFVKEQDRFLQIKKELDDQEEQGCIDQEISAEPQLLYGGK